MRQQGLRPPTAHKIGTIGTHAEKYMKGIALASKLRTVPIGREYIHEYKDPSLDVFMQCQRCATKS